MVKRKQDFERIYVKYAVKSPLIFYLYLVAFISIFLLVSTKMRLEKRQIYEAQIQGNKVEAVCSAKKNLSDNKIYVYTDKNQEVFMFHVQEIEYENGVMRLILEEEQNDILGSVMLEMVEGDYSLFQRIFVKAGDAL